MTQEQRTRLEGKVAIVTGGTAGIGPACCRALAREGARLVVVGRNEGRIEDTLSSLRDQVGSPEVLGLRGDVRNESDMARMAEETVTRFGRIDILIASAGILRAKGSETLQPLTQMTAAAWDEVLDTNLKGIFLSNRAVLPTMMQQREGHILNLSSTSGRKAYAFDTAYCASKFGVIGLSESLADEARHFGIKVECLLPGAIDTPMWEQNGPFGRPDYALPPERVADLLVIMLTLPRDAVIVEPMIEPFAKPQNDGWMAATSH